MEEDDDDDESGDNEDEEWNSSKGNSRRKGRKAKAAAAKAADGNSGGRQRRQQVSHSPLSLFVLSRKQSSFYLGSSTVSIVYSDIGYSDTVSSLLPVTLSQIPN